MPYIFNAFSCGKNLVRLKWQGEKDRKKERGKNSEREREVWWRCGAEKHQWQPG